MTPFVASKTALEWAQVLAEEDKRVAGGERPDWMAEPIRSAIKDKKEDEVVTVCDPITTAVIAAAVFLNSDNPVSESVASASALSSGLDY